MDEIYYFGCIEIPGHFFFDKNLKKVYKDDITPWGFKVDGELQPKNTTEQGICNCHHREFWSCLAFWDNSVDHRGKSCSAFLFKGELLSFQYMVKIAKENFPKIFDRFNFELKKE